MGAISIQHSYLILPLTNFLKLTGLMAVVLAYVTLLICTASIPRLTCWRALIVVSQAYRGTCPIPCLSAPLVPHIMTKT